MEKNNLFKTKKIFLLSLIIPVLILLFSFSNYKKDSIICGNSFEFATKCENFVEYLSSVYGFIWVGFALLGLTASLLAISSLFFFINGKKKKGYTFLVILILLLFFIFYRLIIFPF